MNWRTALSRWLDPDAHDKAERYWYLRGQLSDAQRWLGYEWPEVDATIMWAKVTEVNHFRPLGKDAVAAVPAKPWIHTIYDFREHMRLTYKREDGDK